MANSGLSTQGIVERNYTVPSDYSANQYHIMKKDTTDGQVTISSASTDEHIGILMDKPAAAGRVGRVAVSGIVPVVYGDTVTAGDEITADSSGHGITADGSDVVIGVARKSGVSADIGEVEIQKFYK